jgi:hypothetical protein
MTASNQSVRISKRDLENLISASRIETSHEEKSEKWVSTGSQLCNECTWDGHFHETGYYEPTTTVHIKVDVNEAKLHSALAQSSKTLGQLLILQDTAFENRDAEEFWAYKRVYSQYLDGIKKEHPQLAGELAYAILESPTVGIEKKRQFVADIKVCENYYDLRDFLPETREPVKEMMQNYILSHKEIVSQCADYLTRLWCNLNAQRALDTVVGGLLASDQLKQQDVAKWTWFSELYWPLKNGLAGKDDSKFARSILTSWDKYGDSIVDLIPLNSSIDIGNRPRYEFRQQRPESVFERLKDSAKESAPWLFGIGGALSFGLGAAYCLLASNQGESKESKIMTGAGVLSWLFFGGFFGGALGAGIGTICADLIDKIPLPRTRIQKEYDDAIKSYESTYKQRVAEWKSEAAPKIKQYYQQQTANHASV